MVVYKMGMYEDIKNQQYIDPDTGETISFLEIYKKKQLEERMSKRLPLGEGIYLNN